MSDTEMGEGSADKERVRRIKEMDGEEMDDRTEGERKGSYQECFQTSIFQSNDPFGNDHSDTFRTCAL